MKNQTIEFQQINDAAASSKITRQSFRIPVESRDKVWVVINKKFYVVQDISLGGVSIFFDNDESLHIEQAFLNCEFHVFNEKIKNLKGRIVHLQSVEDDKNRMQIGIQWMDMEKQTQDKMFKIVSKIKEQFLKDGKNE